MAQDSRLDPRHKDTDWVLKCVLVRIAYIRFGFPRFCKYKKWSHMSKLDQGHQRYRLGLKMGHSVHCRVALHKPISDLDS